MPSLNAPPGSNEIIQFYNCLLLRDHQLIEDDLWVRDGKILNPEVLLYVEKGYADVKVDCGGATIAPGFIDLQINGALGVDFSAPTDHDLSAGVPTVAKVLLSHGVTSFCPTVISSTREVYKEVLPHLKRRKGGKHGASLIGVHLEGPFISKGKRGAHPVDYVSHFKHGFQDILDMYGDLDDVAIVTLAPEQNGSDQIITELTRRGVIVSLGHSLANLIEGEAAINNGAALITHLFNAMLPFHHRDPHLMGLLTSNRFSSGKEVYFGIIADGIHTHPAALRIAHRVHPKGLVLVTDAVPPMGLTPGIYTLGSQKVEVQEKKAIIAGTDTLCGSIASMDQCVRKFYKSTECSKVEALESASLHPAKVMKITEQKGTLDYGTDADFVMLDDELYPQATYVAGECVWRNLEAES